MADLADLLAHLRLDHSDFDKGIEQSAEGMRGALGKMKVGAEDLQGSIEGITGRITAAFEELLTPMGMVGAAIAGAFAIGVEAANKFEDALAEIRGSTGATGDLLASLDESFKNVLGSVSSSSDQVAAAIGELSVRTGETGAALEELTKSALEMARVTGSDVGGTIQGLGQVFKVWKVETDSQTESMNTLLTAAQQGQVPLGNLLGMLSRFGPQMQTLGFDLEHGAALLGALNQAGIPPQRTLMALQQTITQMTKQGIEPSAEAWNRLIAQIKGAPDAMTANRIAIDNLGSSGTKLATAIRSGAVDIDAFYAKMRAGRDTVTGASADTQTLGVVWGKFRNEVMLALEPLGVGLITALKAVLTGMKPIIDVVGEMVKAFSEMSGGAQAVGVAIVALGIGAFSPLIGAIGLSVAAIIGLYTAVRDNIAGIEAVFSATFGAVRETLGAAWTGIREGFLGVWNEIGATVNSLSDMFQPIISDWTAAFGTFGPLVEGIFGPLLDTTIRPLMDGIAQLAQAFEGLFGEFPNWSFSVKGIVVAIGETVTAVAALISILQVAGVGVAAFSQILVDVFSANIKGVINDVNDFVGVVAGIVGNIKAPDFGKIFDSAQDAAAKTKTLGDALKTFGLTVDQTTGKVQEVGSAIDTQAQKIQKMSDAFFVLQEASKNNPALLSAVADAAKKLGEAITGSAAATQSQQQQIENYKRALQDAGQAVPPLTGSISEYIKTLQAMVGALGGNATTLAEMENAVDKLTASQKILTESAKLTKLQYDLTAQGFAVGRVSVDDLIAAEIRMTQAQLNLNPAKTLLNVGPAFEAFKTTVAAAFTDTTSAASKFYNAMLASGQTTPLALARGMLVFQQAVDKIWKDVGVTTQAELQQQVNVAKAAYDQITSDATKTAADRLTAEQKVIEAENKLYAGAGVTATASYENAAARALEATNRMGAAGKPLIDLLNGISTAIKNQDYAFKELGITSVAALLNTQQKADESYASILAAGKPVEDQLAALVADLQKSEGAWKELGQSSQALLDAMAAKAQNAYNTIANSTATPLEKARALEAMITATKDAYTDLGLKAAGSMDAAASKAQVAWAVISVGASNALEKAQAYVAALKLIEPEFAQLGITSQKAFNAEGDAAVAAYEKVLQTGSAYDILNARIATLTKVSADWLDNTDTKLVAVGNALADLPKKLDAASIVTALSQATASIGTFDDKTKTVGTDLHAVGDSAKVGFATVSSAASDAVNGIVRAFKDAGLKQDSEFDSERKKAIDTFEAIAASAGDNDDLIYRARIDLANKLAAIDDQQYQLASQKDQAAYEKARAIFEATLGDAKATYGDRLAAYEDMIQKQIAVEENAGHVIQALVLRLSLAVRNVWANAAKELGLAFTKATNDFNDGLSKVIVEGGKFSDVLKKIGIDLSETFIKIGLQVIETFIVQGIGKLLTSLGGVDSAIGGIGKTLGGVFQGGGIGGGQFGGGGGLLGTGIGALSGLGGDAAAGLKAFGPWSAWEGAGAGGTGAAGGAGGLSGIMGGALGGVLGIAGLGVSIVSGIVSGIQGARTNNLLGEIEKSTRGTLAQDIANTQTIWDKYIPALKDINVGVQLAQNFLKQIHSDINDWLRKDLDAIARVLTGGKLTVTSAAQTVPSVAPPASKTTTTTTPTSTTTTTTTPTGLTTATPPAVPPAPSPTTQALPTQVTPPAAAPAAAPGTLAAIVDTLKNLGVPDIQSFDQAIASLQSSYGQLDTLNGNISDAKTATNTSKVSLDGLKGQATVLGDQIKTLKDQIKNAPSGTDVSALKTQLAALNSQMVDLTSQIDAAKSTYDTNNTNLTDLNDQLKQLTQAIADQKSALVDPLKQQLSDLSGQLQSGQAAQLQTSADYKSAKDAVTSLKDQITALKTQIASQSSKEAAPLQTNIANLAPILADAIIKADIAKVPLDAVNASIKDLQDQIKLGQDQVKAAPAGTDTSALKAAIADLQGQLAALQVQQAPLKTTYDDANGNVVKLTAQMKTFYDGLKALKLDNATAGLQQQLDSLVGQLPDAELAQANAKIALDQNTSAVTDLSTQVTALKLAINVATKQIQDLKTPAAPPPGTGTGAGGPTPAQLQAQSDAARIAAETAIYNAFTDAFKASPAGQAYAGSLKDAQAQLDALNALIASGYTGVKTPTLSPPTGATPTHPNVASSSADSLVAVKLDAVMGSKSGGAGATKALLVTTQQPQAQTPVVSAPSTATTTPGTAAMPIVATLPAETKILDQIVALLSRLTDLLDRGVTSITDVVEKSSQQVINALGRLTISTAPVPAGSSADIGSAVQNASRDIVSAITTSIPAAAVLIVDRLSKVIDAITVQITQLETALTGALRSETDRLSSELVDVSNKESALAVVVDTVAANSGKIITVLDTIVDKLNFDKLDAAILALDSHVVKVIAMLQETLLGAIGKAANQLVVSVDVGIDKLVRTITSGLANLVAPVKADGADIVSAIGRVAGILQTIVQSLTDILAQLKIVPVTTAPTTTTPVAPTSTPPAPVPVPAPPPIVGPAPTPPIVVAPTPAPILGGGLGSGLPTGGLGGGLPTGGLGGNVIENFVNAVSTLSSLSANLVAPSQPVVQVQPSTGNRTMSVVFENGAIKIETHGPISTSDADRLTDQIVHRLQVYGAGMYN